MPVAPPPTDRLRTAFLNPFYAYSAVWSVVLGLYALGWSRLYAPLRPGLAIFLVSSIVICLVLGRAVHGNLAKLSERPVSSGWLLKRARLITAVLIAGVFAEFAYAGHVPFADLLLPTGYDYGDFAGIPVVHVLLVTFSIFYLSHLGYHLTRAPRGGRLNLVILFMALLGTFALMLNRGALIFGAFMLGLHYLSITKMTMRRLIPAFLSTIGLLYLFGCLGNLRIRVPFWDNSYIMQISQVSGNFPQWMPGQFTWIYMYIVSPLGNLNDLVDRFAPINDWGYSVINVLPDFLSKRISPGFDPTTTLTVPYFNVSTGWASAWKFNGYTGLWFTFLVLLAVLAAGIVLVRTSLHLVTWALLCGVTAFTFFTNALSYSGVSLALAYPILFTILGRVLTTTWAQHWLGQWALMRPLRLAFGRDGRSGHAPPEEGTLPAPHAIAKEAGSADDLEPSRRGAAEDDQDAGHADGELPVEPPFSLHARDGDPGTD